MIVAERAEVPARVHALDAAVSGAASDLRFTLCEASMPGKARASGQTRTTSDEVLDRLLRAMTAHVAGDAPVGGVEVEAFNRALTLASALPNSLPIPEVVIEDDGEIAFDWDEGPRRVLSVSIGAGSMLTYAALIGPEPTHGRVAFAGSLPITLAFLLRRMYAGANAHHA